MGEAYGARDTKLDRQEALKVGVVEFTSSSDGLLFPNAAVLLAAAMSIVLLSTPALAQYVFPAEFSIGVGGVVDQPNQISLASNTGSDRWRRSVDQA